MMRTVKTSTALRAWRRFNQLIWLTIAMAYAAGTYTLPFAIWGALVVYGLWRCGRAIILVTSKNGKLILNNLI